MLERVVEERRQLLDLLFLVTALGLIINIVAIWLTPFSLPIQWGVVGLSLAFVLWRLMSAPLFALKAIESVQLVLVYNQRHHGMYVCHRHGTFAFDAQFAFQAIMETDEELYQRRFENVIGDLGFGEKVLDIVEFGILSMLSQQYRIGWTIVHETTFEGSRSVQYGSQKGERISFESLPKDLRESNAVIKAIHGAHQNKMHFGLNKIDFVAPPGTTIARTVLGVGSRSLVLKNRFVTIEFRVTGPSGHAGKPSYMMTTEEKTTPIAVPEMLETATLYPGLVATVSLSPWFALLPQAGASALWAKGLVERLKAYFDHRAYSN